MDINIREVKTKKNLKTFIYLPEKLHADHPNWVHPVYVDEWKYFNPKKNEAFSYSDTVLLLAFHGEKAVGRVMVSSILATTNTGRKKRQDLAIWRQRKMRMLFAPF